MQQRNVDLVESYYLAMGEKNTPEMSKYLHNDVEFIGPLVQLQGKESVIQVAQQLTSFYSSLNICSKFASGDQVMIVYDLDFRAPIGKFRVAALMDVRADLIERIELFYDGRPFEREMEHIYEFVNTL
jgi:hypothetical protein